MLKMVIKMNEQKIAAEGKYQVADITGKALWIYLKEWGCLGRKMSLAF